MNTISAKILSLCILLLDTCICGMLPLCLVNCLRRAGTNTITRMLELANLFAGGVFLATLLLHLIPEASDALHGALEDNGLHINYPLSQLLVATGFFLIAITEQIAFCFYHTVPDTGDQTLQPVYDHSINATYEVYDNNIDDISRILPEERTPCITQLSTVDTLGQFSVSYEDSCSDNAPLQTHHTHDHVASELVLTRKTLTIRSLLFFLALSLHSLFEGVAIGLQKSATDVVKTLLAVAIHKGVIAFSFTLSMTQQAILSRVILFYVIALAVISPAGIAIGIAVSNSDADIAADLANGVLQSIAAGTFLFVVFFEILPRELHGHKKCDGGLNLLLTLLGFGLMAGLQTIGSHDHSEI
ncbi:zinc transporter ZIP1-like [Amphiura filiformis]|uniref:zinc transporter ZIP1-like n=1 Tax=Amphiura filiformis TaxID=82378 RepID=UPI003B21BEBB